MKRWVWILGSGALLVMVCLAGACLWAKANLQEIARDLSGKDIRFADVHIHYTPVPAIVLTDLVLKEGLNSVKVPLLKLYPDLKDIIRGHISLEKAVLDDPEIVAANKVSSPDPDRRKSTPPSMAALPDGMVVVNRGKFVLRSAQGESLRGAVSANAKKSSKGLSIHLDRAAINEIGLAFTGKIDITSFVPLKLTVDAQKGKFNPCAVKDFLLKFGYITKADAKRIPAIEGIDAKGLKVDFDADAGNLNVKAETLKLDGVELRNVAVNLSSGTSFSVACNQGVLDTENIYDWFLQNSDGEKIMSRILAQSNLKAIAPHGAIRISSLSLQGSSSGKENHQVFGAINGHVDIDGEGLMLRIMAENGQEQSFTFSQLSSRVTIEEGNPTVKVDRLAFTSPMGGTGTISGRIPVPVDFKRSDLKSAIDGLTIFNSTLDFHLNKDRDSATIFDVALGGSRFNFSAGGTLYCPGRRKTDWELSLNKVIIDGMASHTERLPSQTAALDKAFDTHAIISGKRSAHAYVNTFQYAGLPRLQSVDLHFQSGDNRATLQGTMNMGGVNLTIGAVGLSPGQLGMTVEARGTDIDLTSLIACFSKELPIYLAGRLYLTGNVGVTGKTPRELLNGARGDISIVMNQGMVKQISGLDPRLNFILDILRAAGIRTHKLDTITISKGIINGHLQKDRLIFTKFSIVGPLLSAWGTGEFALADKRLILSGGVKTALGVNRRFDIDRVLEKEKT